LIAIVIVLFREMPHNTDMKTPFRLSGLVGWMGRCGVALIALAFCASALADPSKNVVRPAQPERVMKTAKKMCYTFTTTSGIPMPCDRVGSIPTTASPMTIYTHATTR